VGSAGWSQPPPRFRAPSPVFSTRSNGVGKSECRDACFLESSQRAHSPAFPALSVVSCGPTIPARPRSRMQLLLRAAWTPAEVRAPTLNLPLDHPDLRELGCVRILPIKHRRVERVRTGGVFAGNLVEGFPQGRRLVCRPRSSRSPRETLADAPRPKPDGHAGLESRSPRVLDWAAGPLPFPHVAEPGASRPRLPDSSIARSGLMYPRTQRRNKGRHPQVTHFGAPGLTSPSAVRALASVEAALSLTLNFLRRRQLKTANRLGRLTRLPNLPEPSVEVTVEGPQVLPRLDESPEAKRARSSRSPRDGGKTERASSLATRRPPPDGNVTRRVLLREAPRCSLRRTSVHVPPGTHLPHEDPRRAGLRLMARSTVHSTSADCCQATGKRRDRANAERHRKPPGAMRGNGPSSAGARAAWTKTVT
jgi:hypothetical protein